LLTVEVLDAIAASIEGVLLVDEAYVDFVDPSRRHDAVSLVRRHDNVLLLRTLSKGYSLAGLRLGYGIGASSLIAPMLEKTRDSYNVDAVAQRLAKAAILDRAYAASTWERVRSERERTRAELIALGFAVPPSESNFVLATAPSNGPTAATLHDALETRGILVRYFAATRLDDKLRITIGTRAQNDRLLERLTDLLRRP
jgi:histidinol-phosphate aminotransferase